MKRQSKMLGRDYLANRSDQMTIGRELAAGIQPLQLGNGAIDVGDRSRQLDALRLSGVFLNRPPWTCD